MMHCGRSFTGNSVEGLLLIQSTSAGYRLGQSVRCRITMIIAFFSRPNRRVKSGQGHLQTTVKRFMLYTQDETQDATNAT